MKVVISFIVSLIYLINYFNYESVTKSKSYYINEIDIKDGDIKMDKKYYNIEVLDEEKIRNLKWFIYSGLYPYNEFKIYSSLKLIINDSILNNQSKLHPWFRLEAMKRGYLPMDYFYVIQEKIPWLEKVEKN